MYVFIIQSNFNGSKAILVSTHNILFQYKTANPPKLSHICSYGIFSKGLKKRAISVRASEVLNLPFIYSFSHLTFLDNEQIFMKESILIKKGREPECVEVSNEKTPGKLTKDAYNGLPGDNWCKSIRNCSRISKSRPSATDNSMDGVNTILFCK